MKIEFEASNIEELKQQIIDYALAHLGLKYQDGIRKNIDKYALRNPHENPVGRQPGWRKQKIEKVIVGPGGVPAKESAPSGTVNTVEEPGPTVLLKYSDTAKKIECKNMVAAVMGRFQDSLGSKGAFEKAKDCLTEFGVEHLDYLNPAAYEEFISYCKKVMGAK